MPIHGWVHEPEDSTVRKGAVEELDEAGVPKPAVTRPASAEDLDLLGQLLPEFTSVPDETCREILDDLAVMEVEPGDTLLRQGEKDNHIECIPQGLENRKRDEH